MLDDFYKAIENPGDYARGLKESGKKIIGYFCSYTPEEIILASGAHPMRLFGTSQDITLADAHFQTYCCSLVRGGLEEALSGRLDFLDGTVFPHTCDSMQRLSDVWRLNTKFKFFADVVLPVKLNTESSREYMRDVLHKFKRELEKWLGSFISDEHLRESIRKYNSIRSCLRIIYDLRSKSPELISGSDVHAVTKASMIMDRDYLVEKLPLFIEEIKQGKYENSVDDKKRLILSGSVCNHPDIYGILEKAGGIVVWDDLCTGYRSFEQKISEKSDPIAAIAGRYSERLVCPAKHMSITSRGDSLVELAKEKNAHGVIFLLLKFCDPHSFDYPYIKEFLDKENIPNMLYEVEDRLPPEGQLLTRFETFVHML